MSADHSTLSVGDVMPECQIPLRADGTCEQAGYFLDPVQMQLVLAADVSPWHEEAIIRACRVDQPGPDGTKVITGANRRRLWVWSMLTEQPTPAIGISLWLKPTGIRLPEVAWMVHYDAAGLCGGCAQDIGIRALLTGQQLRNTEHQGIRATIILVGRDHRVLSISRPACHGLIGSVWLVQLGDACFRSADQTWQGCRGVPAAMISHVVGQPECMAPDELDQYLVAKGWRESAKQRRLRDKRQRGDRRAQG